MVTGETSDIDIFLREEGPQTGSVERKRECGCMYFHVAAGGVGFGGLEVSW